MISSAPLTVAARSMMSRSRKFMGMPSQSPSPRPPISPMASPFSFMQVTVPMKPAYPRDSQAFRPSGIHSWIAACFCMWMSRM